MNDEQIKQFKELLEFAKSEVKREIELLTESAKPVAPENSLGRLARMEAINQQKVQERALQNSKNRLRQVEQALQRIESEDFGYCLECGEEISQKRLEAAPYGALCLRCAA